MGITFPNPVGLAAGFDKNAEVYKTMQAFGFGFIEIGTVTPKPQEGNPKPRMFRLIEDKSIINRMGFNNDGVVAIAKRIKNNNKVIIGGNIGKNKITPNEEAINDYKICFNQLFELVDYFVVNVSSPNTPGLRELQNKEALLHILGTLQNINHEKEIPKPLLLKIAPDLTTSQLDEIIEVCVQCKLDGIIATNTTISRDNLRTEKQKVKAIGNGGLSGAAITQKSTEIIRYIRSKVSNEFVIIGVGGISNGQDAIEKIAAGANLVQVYSGLVYKGPTLITNIKRAIRDFSLQH